MDLEQIIKRLDWIDEERRKDKTTIATLQERLLAMEGNIPSLTQQIKDMNGEITRLITVMARLDQFESSLAQTRVDFSRMVENNEKLRLDHEREVDKVRRVELEGVNKTIGEVRKGLEPIPDLRKAVQARQEEEFRLVRLIEEINQKVIETNRYDEEYKRSLRLIEEGRRQDAKRLTDIQGEVAAIRKRVDEQRGKVDITSDNLRKIETRISELLTAESERRQSQTSFIEKQTLWQVERDRTWKEWQVRFEIIEKSALNLDAQLQSLDATQRSVKRSQDAVDDATQRFDRRINEITEMQRLGEDRFRQEWVTLKADDQKRWTSFTLSQDETRKDSHTDMVKMEERLTALEDVTQSQQDVLQQTKDANQQMFQGMLAQIHELLSAYERIMSSK